MSDEVVIVDLFAGAGGFSEGARQACERLDGVDLVAHIAINHWECAVETHRRNHPDAVQYHSKIEQLDPATVVAEALGVDPGAVRSGEIDATIILLAGPECTHFSSARGGKPVDEQQRASPWHVLDWLEKLDVEAFLIENVKEIQSWGPVVDGQPSRDGSVFDAWVNALHSLGYSVEWTELCAADYGDPTSRERFILIGRRNARATFPDPTHSDDDPDKPDRRTAAEIIDWSDPGTSIWTRDLTEPRVHTPPKDTTMQRIAEGIRRHCDDRLEPFADALAQLGRDEIRFLREERVVDREHAEIVADAIDEPFLVPVRGRDRTAMAVPSILRQQDGGHPWPATGRPLPTIAARGGHAIATPLPSLIMPKNGPRRDHLSNPLYPADSRPHHTITSDSRSKLVTPYLTPLYNGCDGQRPRTRSVDRPLMTITASKSP
ncbi:MAG: DNA cytosine methyltransferase, partial [Halococcoides sp.]